jgi:hypothetical protein
LATIAYGTGGSFFHNSNDFVKGFKQLIDPDVRYLMTFHSDAQPDGRYHPLKVKLASSNHYALEARPGYYAPTADEVRIVPVSRALDAALLANDPQDALPVTLTVHASTGQNGRPAAVAEIHVDLQHLDFEVQEGRRKQKVTFAAILLDDHDRVVTGKIGALDFALKETTFQRFSEDGANGSLVLAATAGAYLVRLVAIDRSGGKLSAVTQQLVLR